MRISSLAVAIAAFLLAALCSALAAQTVVRLVEDVSALTVQEALIDQGHGWAGVQADGLQVVIEGEAPSEAIRFRAMSIAGGIVDASRVIDAMSVQPTEALAPPEFEIEILRNDSGISLIGLVPATTDRERVMARLARVAGDEPVADFLESADYAAPESWADALEFALSALERLPQSKISVTADRVAVTAIAMSEEEKRRIETDLARTVPEGIRLGLLITAPRPVITPFTVRFVRDENGGRFDACAADTIEAQRAIIAAALAAGADGRLACPLGLGVPTVHWGEAVEMGLAALAEIGSGTITFSDADVYLTAEEGSDPDLFDRVAGELENDLPEVFALTALLPVAPEAPPDGVPEFTATLSPEGLVQVRGRVPDDLVNSMVRTFAVARFGQEKVSMGTRVVTGLPQGWSVRLLAGLEALSMLSNGSVLVRPDLVAVRGDTGNRDASAEISRLMIEKLGPEATLEIAVSYDEALDPVVGLPTPDECIRRIGVLTDSRRILFDPGSATLTSDTQPVVDDIAEILRQCLDLPMVIAGYTDSQGSEGGNQRLSQQRADAVLAALRSRRVPVGSFAAVGFGEADPIADNATEDGREANRRIEFRLVAEEPLPGGEDATGEAGVDGAGEDGAGDADASGDEVEAAE